MTNNPSEQRSLLETILSHTSSVMFLAPHFSPMCCTHQQFVELYDRVVLSIPCDIDTVVFVLLSKFEVPNWLSQKPSQMNVSNFLSRTIKAVGLIGREPNTEGVVILEIIRNHLNTLLRSDLNTHYWLVLTELLSLSAGDTVSVLCWSDFLSILEFGEDLNPEKDCRVTIDRIKESLHYMASYFRNVCESLDCELETLYKIWEPYIEPFTILMKNLFSYTIAHSLYHRGERPKEVAVREQWELVMSVFRPWIIPRLAGKVWTLLRVESVIEMVGTFASTIYMLVNSSFQDDNGNFAYCFVLNDLLAFYASEIAPGVREDQSVEIFHTSLLTLPWQHLCPTLQEMAFVIQV